MSDRLKTVKNVKLINITEDPDKLIERAGRICYGGTCKPEKAGKFVKARVREGHLSLGRHATATFEVDCSRACSHQLCRHPHISLHQRSQRYCNEQNFDFVYPPEILRKETGNEAIEVFNEVIKEIRNGYKKLVELGVKKEDARFLLPNACKTKLILTGNFQAWYDFLKLRLSKHAQWEIREIAEEIRDVLIEKSEFFYEFKLRKIAEENKKNYNFPFYEAIATAEIIEELDVIELFHSLYPKIMEIFPDATIQTEIQQFSGSLDVNIEEISLPEDEVLEGIVELRQWACNKGEQCEDGMEGSLIFNNGITFLLLPTPIPPFRFLLQRKRYFSSFSSI